MPSALVRVSLLAFVSSLIAVTLTLAMGAREGSITSPTSSARKSCACAVAPNKETTSNESAFLNARILTSRGVYGYAGRLWLSFLQCLLDAALSTLGLARGIPIQRQHISRTYAKTILEN